MCPVRSHFCWKNSFGTKKLVTQTDCLIIKLLKAMLQLSSSATFHTKTLWNRKFAFEQWFWAKCSQHFSNEVALNIFFYVFSFRTHFSSRNGSKPGTERRFECSSFFFWTGLTWHSYTLRTLSLQICKENIINLRININKIYSFSKFFFI